MVKTHGFQWSTDSWRFGATPNPGKAPPRGCPKSWGYPPCIIHFCWGFPMMNRPAIKMIKGYHHFWKPRTPLWSLACFNAKQDLRRQDIAKIRAAWSHWCFIIISHDLDRFYEMFFCLSQRSLPVKIPLIIKEKNGTSPFSICFLFSTRLNAPALTVF